MSTQRRRTTAPRPGRTPARSSAAATPGARTLPAWLAEIARSHSGRRVAAVFDFDGTLIAGYSITSFLTHRLRNGEIGLAAAGRSLRDFVEYASGGIDNLELIARGIGTWRGKRADELEKLGGHLHTTEFEDRIFPEMRTIIEAHRRRGHTLVVATSATRFQVAATARALGIDHVLATRLETRGGRLTGAIEGKLLWGPHKAAAVREFAAAHGVDLAQSWFYADGNEDEALMHLVGHARPVNPRPRLRRVAQRRGWPTHTFTSRGPTDSGALLRRAAAIGGLVPATLSAIALQMITGEKRDAANLLTSVVPDVTLALARVRLNVIGQEHLWTRRPAVFIWNHRNVFDAQIVGKLVQRDFGAVAKKELATVPIFALASRFMHIAFLDRSDSRAAVEQLAPATRLLEQGYSMVVAPEGTRARGTEIGPFKKGAFRMAMSAGVPIVPIVIRNADVLGARTDRVPRPGRVDVVVLPPVDVSGWTRDDLDGRIEDIRKAYVDALRDWPGPVSF